MKAFADELQTIRQSRPPVRPRVRAVANAVFVRYFLLGQEMWSDALPIARTDRHFYPEEQALGSTRSCSSVGSRWLDGGAIGIFAEGVSHLNLESKTG